MNIKGGFFSDYESDAIDEMKKMVGCNVRRCVFPSCKNLIYYISEKGDVFSMQKIQGKCLTRGPKKKESNQYNGRRKDGGVTYRLNLGGMPRREKWIACERLVYCTFILGRWEPDVRIHFKNGKASDIRPENLEVMPDELPPGCSERMAEYREIYQRDYNRIAQSVKWWCGIPIEDAKDVVSDTFIWLCSKGFKGVLNSAIWTYWSWKRGFTFAYRKNKMQIGESYDVELEIRGITDPTPEIDLFHIHKVEKQSRYLQLWAQGHTPTEIAEMEGAKKGSVSCSITRSIRFLQKYFKHEKKYLRP